MEKNSAWLNYKKTQLDPQTARAVYLQGEKRPLGNYMEIQDGFGGKSVFVNSSQGMKVKPTRSTWFDMRDYIDPTAAGAAPSGGLSPAQRDLMQEQIQRNKQEALALEGDIYSMREQIARKQANDTGQAQTFIDRDGTMVLINPEVGAR